MTDTGELERLREALVEITKMTDSQECCGHWEVGDEGPECCGSPTYGLDRCQAVARAALEGKG